LIREIIPAGSQVAALFDPNQPTINSELQEIQKASKVLGLQLQVFRAGTPEQIDAAFARMKDLRVSGLIVSPSLFYSTQRVRLTNTAIAQHLPTIFGQKEYALVGGLMSYGADPVDAYFEAGVYAAKVLKGARPADLPVLQLDKFQLVINQKTAKTLSLTFPSGIISIADEVIE
jgi:putative ABC transport system substrate-binding protein